MISKELITILQKPVRFINLQVRLKTSGSSKSWIQRHINDPYVKQAGKDNIRSRSAYKLQELQDKYKIIKPTDFVVDLGAAPGGWSVVASKILDFDRKALLISVDLLDMDPIPFEGGNPDGHSVHFIRGDFNSVSVRDELQRLGGLGRGDAGPRQANVVLSDMLQNTSGHASTDHFKSMDICNSVLEFTEAYLQPGGHLLCKFFQGSDDQQLLADAKAQFKSTKLVKPKSSRTESREMYLLALNKIG